MGLPENVDKTVAFLRYVAYSQEYMSGKWIPEWFRNTPLHYGSRHGIHVALEIVSNCPVRTSRNAYMLAKRDHSPLFQLFLQPRSLK